MFAVAGLVLLLNLHRMEIGKVGKTINYHNWTKTQFLIIPRSMLLCHMHLNAKNVVLKYIYGQYCVFTTHQNQFPPPNNNLAMSAQK